MFSEFFFSPAAKTHKVETGGNKRDIEFMMEFSLSYHTIGTFISAKTVPSYLTPSNKERKFVHKTGN